MLGQALAAALAVVSLDVGAVAADARQSHRHPALVLVAGSTAPAQSADGLSPEEKMRRRYPQPVKVGDLIGLPLLDDDDRTLGRVKSVVRTGDGKIKLIVAYGGFFGWGQRPVAVPLEAVAIAGRQLAALDMTRAQLDAAPDWTETGSQPIASGEIIRVALYRR
jgi:hypothetical protein